MTIETERLILRPWHKEDAVRLFELASDPEIGPACGWQPHKDLAESAWAIENVLNGPECYALVLKETGTVCGCAEIMGQSRYTDRQDEGELGYWLAKSHWGKGLMPEAAAALLERSFEELHLAAVWCSGFEENTKSARVMEKLGFEYVKTARDVEMPLLKTKKTLIIRRMDAERWKKLHSR